MTRLFELNTVAIHLFGYSVLSSTCTVCIQF